MALEGTIMELTVSGEQIYTNDHPAVLQALVMDSTVTTAVPAGTILKAVTDEDVDGASYAICTATDSPAAVLTEDFDPDKQENALCLLHGTVKKRLLKVNAQAPALAMLDALQAKGIFCV